MKPLLTLLLVTSFFLIACDGPGTDRDGTTRTGEQVSDLQFIDNEFIDDFYFSPSDLQQNFDDYEVFSKDEVENRHVPGQIDTILTIQAGGNSISQFYIVNNDALLQHSIIRSAGYDIPRNIEIGMTTTEFMQAFPQQNENLTNDAEVTVSGDHAPIFAIFRFSNDVLQEIEYQGYVD